MKTKIILSVLWVLVATSFDTFAKTCKESLQLESKEESAKALSLEGRDTLTDSVIPEQDIDVFRKYFSWINAFSDKSQKTSPEIMVHQNSEGQPVKSKVVILSVHGLYNHPGWMHEISKSYFKAGYNVYNCKLPGHFEINKTQLDSTNRSEWYASMKHDIEMAKKLGQKVVIVGHSLGGSLALKAALEFPELVNGVVLLAPGLELDRWQAIKVWMTNRSWFGMGPTLMKLFGISRTDKYDRYLSSAAAVQEGLILEDILAMAPSKEDLYRRMNQTAVMMVNTKAETTINEDVNLLAINKLMNREHHPLTRSLVVSNVLHRSVPVADPNENPDFPIIEKETIQFINELNDID